MSLWEKNSQDIKKLFLRSYGAFLPEERKIHESFLSCGARLVTRRTPGLPYADIRVHVDGAGAGAELAGDYPRGTAHFLEHICANYTKGCTPYQGKQEIEKLGGSHNAMTSLDSMTFVCRVPSEKLGAGLRVIVNNASQPQFNEDYIRSERGVIQAEWLRADMGGLFAYHFMQTLRMGYGEDPYFFQPIGTLESIGEIKKEHLESFFASKFLGSNTTILLEGDVKHGSVHQYFEKNFALSRGTKMDYPSSPFTGGVARYSAPTAGVNSALIFQTSESHDLVASAIEIALMRFVNVSLFSSLRESGRVYDIRFNRMPYRGKTHMDVSFSAFPKNVPDCLSSIGRSIEDLAERGDEEGLNSFKELLQKEEKNRKSSPSRGVDSLLSEVLHFGKIMPQDTLGVVMGDVTNNQIKEAASKILSSPYAFLAGGAVELLPRPQEIKEILRWSKDVPCL